MLTIEEVARELEVSTATVRNWYKAGVLTAEKDGRRLMFHGDRVKLQKAGSARSRTQRVNRLNNSSRTPNAAMKSQRRARLINGLSSLVDQSQNDLSSVMCGVAAAIHVRTSTPAAWQLLELWAAESDASVYGQARTLTERVCLDPERDLVGEIYQSLLTVSQRSKAGMYLTPVELVHRITHDRPEIKGTIVDPACGTGRFLSASLARSPGSKVIGVENDPICVWIARVTLSELEADHRHEIMLGDGLAWLGAPTERIDWIVGNPPWGSRVIHQPESGLASPSQATAMNAACVFTLASIKAVRDGGRVTFLLPGTLFAVKQHLSFRQELFQNATLESMEFLGSRFQGVQSDATCIDVLNVKAHSTHRSVQIVDRKGTRQTRDLGAKEGSDLLLLEHDSDDRSALLSRVLAVPHFSLQGNSEWALGVVTGNNSKFVSTALAPETEPVFRGRDVFPMGFAPPERFIEFKPEMYQQVAPGWKYRAPEKIIYRFISDRIVCAYDDQQRLTLNSANIVIPTLELPVRVVALLLNSALYQFIFKIRYDSTKVLRSHLESMPIPKLTPQVTADLDQALQEHIETEAVLEMADEAVALYFNLTHVDRQLLAEV